MALRHQKKLPPTADDAIATIPETFPEFCESFTIMTTTGLAPFSLVDWQLDFSDLLLNRLADKPANFSIMKSRQLGNTLLVLLMDVWQCLRNPLLKVLVLDRTERDAMEHARELRTLLNQLSIPLLTDNLSLLQFTNGSKIYFRSADPATCGRGLRSVSIIHIEEQGHQPLLEKTLGITDAISNGVPNAKRIMIGTPNGKAMYYYEVLKKSIPEEIITATVTGIRDGSIEPYQVFTQNQIDYGVLINWRSMPWLAAKRDPDFLEEKRQSGLITEAALMTEYELEFSESESAVFSPALVASCVDADLEPIKSALYEKYYEEPQPEHMYYAGGDPNGGSMTSGDAASLVILRKASDSEYKVVYIYRSKTGTTSLHVSRWADALKAFNPMETRIESNNSGYAWIEQIVSLCPELLIEPSKTTSATRDAMISTLTIAMERSHLKIPVGQLQKELLSFVFDPRTNKAQAASGSNDDTIFALMHCLIAASYTGQTLTGGFFT